MLSVLGGLIYFGTSDSRVREEHLTHNVDTEKMEILKANKIAASLERHMEKEDEKSEHDEKNLIKLAKQDAVVNTKDKEMGGGKGQEVVSESKDDIVNKRPPPKILQPSGILTIAADNLI